MEVDSRSVVQEKSIVNLTITSIGRSEMSASAAPLPEPIVSAAIHPVDEILTNAAACCARDPARVGHVRGSRCSSLSRRRSGQSADGANRLPDHLRSARLRHRLVDPECWHLEIRHSPASHHGCDFCGRRTDGCDRVRSFARPAGNLRRHHRRRNIHNPSRTICEPAAASVPPLVPAQSSQ